MCAELWKFFIIRRDKIKDAYLTFYDLRTCGEDVLKLPEGKVYRVELIDTWEMTRTVLFERAGGETKLMLPGKEGMAVLATAISG